MRSLALSLLAALPALSPALAQDLALEITDPFSRATLPNAPVAAGFLTVANNGAEDDRLVAAAPTLPRTPRSTRWTTTTT